MDDEDDFGGESSYFMRGIDVAYRSTYYPPGYGSDEVPSIRPTKKPAASSSSGSTAKRKPAMAKASSSKPVKATTGARGGASRGRGKAAATRTRGRPATSTETEKDDEEEEQEVIDIEADIDSVEEKDEEDVDMEEEPKVEPEPVKAGRPRRAVPKETGTTTVTSKPASGSKASKGKGIGTIQDDETPTTTEHDLEKELAQLRSQLARRTEERDTLSKQFKDLESKKGGEMEKLYDKLKESSGNQAKAQDTIIETLEQLNKKLESQVTSLTKSLSEIQKQSTTASEDLVVAKTRTEALEREAKRLKHEMDEARKIPPQAPLPPDLKKLEEEVRELKGQVGVYKGKVEEKQNEVNTLTQDLQQEIKISKAALAESQRQAAAMSKLSNPAVSTSAKDVAADKEQNEQVIKLYEDLTNLMVPKVNIVKGGNGEEVTFVCIQTVEGRSMSFKLKIFKKASPDPSKPGGWIYTKVIRYVPLDLELEDQAFVESLGVFKQSLEMPMTEAIAFWTNLRETMMPDDEE